MIIFGHTSFMIMEDNNVAGFELSYPINYRNFFDKFVLLSSDPKIILNNRSKDKQRKRVTNLEIIKLEIKIEKAFLTYITNNKFVEMEYNNKLNEFIKKFGEIQDF